MTDIAIRQPAIEGYVELSEAQHLTASTDLDFVLDQLASIDPIEVESENPTSTDWAVHHALYWVRAQVMRRQAVQAGPDAVVYCGLSGDYGRACGFELGLPDCIQHSTCSTCGLSAKTGGTWWFRDHRDGGCPDAPKALDGREG